MKGYTTSGPPTLRTVWHLFTVEDRAIIRYQLTQQLPKHANLHAGLLPFVVIEEAITALDIAFGKSSSRRLKELKTKLEAVAYTNDDALILKLNDAKVVKRFGTHPEHGKPFPWLPADLSKFTPIEKDAVVKTTFHETPCIALIRTGQSGWWRVQCDPRHRGRVEEWLLDYCC